MVALGCHSRDVPMPGADVDPVPRAGRVCVGQQPPHWGTAEQLGWGRDPGLGVGRTVGRGPALALEPRDELMASPSQLLPVPSQLR